MELFYDTETSGLPNKSNWTDPSQPHVIQLGFILSDADTVFAEGSFLVKPAVEDWSIHPKAEEVHGISKEQVMDCGLPAGYMAKLFTGLCMKSTLRICHNVGFDQKLMTILLRRHELSADYVWQDTYCTMFNSVELCQLPGKYGKPKWPQLQELHKHLFDEEFEGAHSALEDVRATRRCYYKLKELGL